MAGDDLSRWPEVRSHGAWQTVVKDLRFYSRDERRFLEGSGTKGSLWRDAQVGAGRNGEVRSEFTATGRDYGRDTV